MKKIFLLIILLTSCSGSSGNKVIKASNISNDCKWVLITQEGLHLEFYVEKLGKNNFQYESVDYSNGYYNASYDSGRLVVGNDILGGLVMNFLPDDERFNMFKDAYIRVPSNLWKRKPQVLQVQLKHQSSGKTWEFDFDRVKSKGFTEIDANGNFIDPD